MADLGIVEHLVELVDRPRRDRRRLEPRDPFGRGRARQRGLDARLHLRVIRPGARGWSRSAPRSGAPRRPRTPQKRSHWPAFISTTLSQPSFVRNASAGVSVGLRLPTRAGRWPESKQVGDRIGEEAERRAEQVHVEVLARAGPEPVDQGRADGAERQVGGRHVGDRPAGPGRRVAGHAGDAHEAAHALGDGVVAGALGVRPRLAEAAHRDVDDPGVHARARPRSRPRADRRRPARSSRRRRRSGAASSRTSRAPSGVLEVDGDRALVPVDGGEDGAHAAAPGAAAPLAEVVARARGARP